MTAEIISIGDELLIGQVINTNQAYIAERLNSVGVTISRMTTVGDDEGEILSAFRQSVDRSDIVTVTGGLGPTHDDITRAVVCKFFGTELVADAPALENIKQIFARRGYPMTPLNERQALVPRGCTVIQNRFGTAPGYFFERSGRQFFVMPGVPSEMKAMVDNFIVPHFKKNAPGFVILHRTLKTTGIPESFLADRLGDINSLFSPNSGITLAFLPSPTGVRLRISVKSPSANEAGRSIKEVERKIREKAEKFIYAADDEELEDVVGRLLTERKLHIAVAESCTGGLIADRITNVPGSSAYFERGLTTYSDSSKMSELGVPSALFQQFGAVSREVAEAMAAGARMKANVEVGISTTGIAGPKGGSPEKPVGLVWVGYSDQHETLALKFNFGDQRLRVKERTAQAALELLRRKLLKLD